MTEFRLLGSLEAVDSGRSLALGGHRQRAVLAVLLLRHGEVVSVDAIVDAVWGEQVPKTAVAYLQNCISRLRTQLGYETIETRAPGYALRVDPGDIDAVRFSRLVGEAEGNPAAERFAALSDALALWRGTALADFVFEDFAQPSIRHLNALRLEAIEGRIEAQLELGRQVEVIAEIEALAAAHPSHERLRYLQMLALYRSGRQVDALAVFQEARLALAEELGLEPSEELRALERMILDHDPALQATAATDEEPTAKAREERRIVTILRAAPIVSGEVETEPAREVAARWLAAATAIVQSHGGTLQRREGTELIATFGLEAAREDDAMRALRTGSEIREHGARLGTGWRCRIETQELIVAGGILDDRGDETIHQGPPNEVLLDPATLRLVRGAVEAVPAADGSDYRLLGLIQGAPPVRRRFDAALVGREQELARLEDAVEAAWQAETTRSVVVVGEPGVGKTRLAAALAERLSARALALTGRCAPYGEGTTYLPLLEVITQVVGPGNVGRGISRLLAGSADAERISECLAALGTGVASVRSADMFWAVRRFFEILAEDRPLLVVLDDVQWGGQLLLDLVEYIVGWCEAPVAIVSLARPELLEHRSGWAAGALDLRPLEAAAAQALLDAIPERSEIDRDVDAAILRTAEGNPLFLEQVAAMAGDTDLVPGAVPPTLEALLTSRLDALPPADRDVLERAAVAGREFSRAEVEALSPSEELAAVGPGLMALVRRRLVRPDRAAALSEDGFRFEHILIRDAAYATIPGDRRSDFHERLAVWLESRDASPEVVGFHLEAASHALPEPSAHRDRLAHDAATRLGEAGLQATARLDTAGATRFYERAVDLLPSNGAQRRMLEIELAHALTYEGRMAESASLLEAVEQHARVVGDLMLERRAQVGLALPRLIAGDISAAAVRALADETEPLFVAANDFYAASRSARLRVNADDVLMQYARADEDAQRCAEHVRRAGLRPLEVTHRAVAWVVGPTPVETARERIAGALDDVETSRAERGYLLMYLAELDAMSGSFGSAREYLAQAEQLYLEFSQAFAMVTVWPRAAALIEQLAGHPATAATILETAAVQLDATANAGWYSAHLALRAAALADDRRFDEAIDLAESARAAAPADELSAQIGWRSTLARGLASRGDDADAERVGAEAVELARTTEAPCYLAEALLALAEARSRAGPAVAAYLTSEALQLLTNKGNVARAAQVRERVGA